MYRFGNPELKQRVLYLVLMHILCWSVYIVIEVYSNYLLYNKRMDAGWIYAVFYTLNISLFYGILALQRFNSRHPDFNWWRRSALWLLLALSYLMVKFLVNYAIYFKELGSIREQLPHLPNFLSSAIIRSTHFFIPAFLYGAALKAANYQRELFEAEKAQLVRERTNAELAAKLANSENAFLLQQLNPHMLFNALNLIYSYVQKQSDDGGVVIERLTDILRYSLSASGGGDQVVLTDEVVQINNLIAINQQRFDYPLSFNAVFKGDFQSYRIAPLILFTLAENIFKHGDLRADQRPATLVIEMEETGRLIYRSRNVCKKKSRYERSSSIGLRNIRTRLEYLYPGRYTLETEETDHLFTVNLQIRL